MRKRKYIAFIFARGGSKGVPRKNIKILGDLPLIAYAIKSAKKSKYISRIFVSTDDDEIANVAKEYGAEVPFLRPSELATDTAPEILSWRHAIDYLTLKEEFSDEDVFISIPCTSPFRTSEDIDNCIDSYKNNNSDIAITITDAHRHPSFNMVKMAKDGLYNLVMPSKNNITRRQDAPEVYDVTTVCYVSSPKYLKSCNSLFEGRVSASLIPNERALDIDTNLDFKFAEFLIKSENENN